MSYSLSDFTKDYFNIKEKVPSYRMGQHFINLFIKDGYDLFELRSLWDEVVESFAMHSILKIIEQYQWDYNDLPLLNKDI